MSREGLVRGEYLLRVHLIQMLLAWKKRTIAQQLVISLVLAGKSSCERKTRAVARKRVMQLTLACFYETLSESLLQNTVLQSYPEVLFLILLLIFHALFQS